MKHLDDINLIRKSKDYKDKLNVMRKERKTRLREEKILLKQYLIALRKECKKIYL